MLLGDCSLWGLFSDPWVTRALEGAARKTDAFFPHQIASYLGSHWEMEAVTAPYTEGLFPKLPRVSGSFLLSQCSLIELLSISTLPTVPDSSTLSSYRLPPAHCPSRRSCFPSCCPRPPPPLRCVLHGSRGPVRHNKCCTCLVPRRREYVNG